ncbi:MAG: ectonucleotide pyrophosphatase/phosphodiesterase [Clostridium sp.]|nr:ectonucleotide pyrophosphatase/phosphodiesterase [Clostridium sp.]
MNSKCKRLYIISLDALSQRDFEYISTLDNFKEFLKEASYSKNVASVYPSLTYPAHVSIVTGKYPKNHGIINNTKLQINRKSPDWYWHRKDIKAKTIYDAAIEEGMKVGAFLWPVTAKSKIQYNMPEIFANRPWQNQILVSVLNGTPLFQYSMNKKYGYLRDGINQPRLDNFTHKVMLDSIKNKNLDITFVHYTDLDSMRHEFGFYSNEAKDALKRHDKRIGEIVAAIKEKGNYDESAIIILGDHSTLDENKVINLNVLLKEQGYIEVNSKGRIINYKAIVNNCDGAAYVYVKNNDEKIAAAVKNVIENFNKGNECLEKIYTSKEAEEFGANKNCSFMLEAAEGYYFQDDVQGEKIVAITKENAKKLHYTRATHGYSPLKPNYGTVFMARGAGIKQGVIVDKMSLVDEGPTIAKLMGLNLGKTDGSVLNDILDSN